MMLSLAASRGGLCKVARSSLFRTRLATYAKSAAEEQKIFWQKNAKLNRPLSPHLTIYRLPLTANLSVMHRGTGAYMAGVLIVFGLGSYYFGGNFERVYELLRDNVHPHIMLTAKFFLAFPLVYHTLNGIRHLTWDTGRGLKLQQLKTTGWGIIALAVIGALALTTL